MFTHWKCADDALWCMYEKKCAFACDLGGYNVYKLLSSPCTTSKPVPNRTLLNLGRASSNFFSSSCFQGLSFMFCVISSHCQCFAHSFLFASQRSNSLASSYSFHQDLRSYSPCCKLRELVQKPSTAFRTLDHSDSPFAAEILTSFSYASSLFHFLQPERTFLRGFFLCWTEPRRFSQSAASNLSNPTICCQRPSFLLI